MKYLIIFLFAIEYLYIIYSTKKSLHMLQQNLYNENNRFLKWIFKNKKNTLMNLNFYGIIFAAFLFFEDNFKEINIKLIFLTVCCLVYMVSLYVDRQKRKLDQNKKPLVVTKRIKRLIFTLVILYSIPAVVYFFKRDALYYCLLALAIMTSLNYIVVYIANVINHPMERIIYHKFERAAKNKLASIPGLKIIGITGSYGKTSCKNILNDILNVKFNALATPKSLNTFNGLMITVNNQLSKFDDVFIAEMGAYVKGEINGLCKLVGPKYGIITSIGTAHLETFGSEENIITGKMELIEYLPSDGVGVLNKDDKKQREYKIKKKDHAKILWIGIDEKDVDVRAENIECNYKGTSFDVIFKGDKNKYHFETKLLGKHNVYNILSALALGKEFGLEVSELQQGVKKVEVVEHRLEVKKLGNFYQIDDAYNSNPVGAKSALDVLNLMKGTKVVVTPGMIELGDKEKELNQEFGRQIAKVADYVILIGENRTIPIKNGLLDEKYDEKNIYVLNDVREAYTLINKLKGKDELYALFENDLPDTYTE